LIWANELPPVKVAFSNQQKNSFLSSLNADRCLKIQTFLPGSLGQGLNPAMVEKATPIENHFLDLAGQRPCSDESAHPSGGFDLPLSFGLNPQLRAQG
jgi:hypothetical protein